MGCSRDIEDTMTNTFNEETMRGYMSATPPEQWSKELRRALRDDGWVWYRKPARRYIEREKAR